MFLKRAAGQGSPVLPCVDGCSGELVKRPAGEMLPLMLPLLLLLLLLRPPPPPLPVVLLVRNSANSATRRNPGLHLVLTGPSSEGAGCRSLATEAAVEPLLLLLLLLFVWQVSMADDLACVLVQTSPAAKLLTTVVGLYSLPQVPPLPPTPPELLLLLQLLVSKFVGSGEVAGLYPRLLVLPHLVSKGSPCRDLLVYRETETPPELIVLLWLEEVVLVAMAMLAGVPGVEPLVLPPPPVSVPSISAQGFAVLGKIVGLHSRPLLVILALTRGF